MEAKVKQVPQNANPVLSVDKNGCVLYSNEAGNLLLNEWGVKAGEKLPSNIGDLVERVISRNSPEKIEVKVGNRVYMIVFHPLPEQELVSISGFDISAQEKSEEKFLENEQLYKTLFDTTQDGFVLIEPIFDEAGNSDDYVMLKVNRSWEHQTGLKAAELLGKRISDVLPELEPIWPYTFGEVAKKGKSMHFESYNHNSNKWYDLHAFPYQQGLVGVIFRDITERKKVEEKLKESEKRQAFLLRLNDALRPIEDPVAIQETTSRMMAEHLDIGRVAYCEIRYEPDIVVIVERDWPRRGMPSIAAGRYRMDDFGTFLAEEFTAGRPAIVADAATDPRISQADRDNWNRFEIAASCGFPIIKEGRFVAYFVAQDNQRHNWTEHEIALLREVSERTWAAVERSKTEETLRESELKYRTLSNTLEEKVKERTAELEEAYNSLKENERSHAEAQKMAHIGNWEQNCAINKLHWSDEMYCIFGLNPQEVEVNYDLFLTYVHPDDLDNVKNTIKEALNGNPFDVNYRIILASGEKLIVHSKGEVVFDGNSNPVRIRGTLQDITESKRMEEQIRQRVEELEMIMDVAPVAIFIAYDPQGNNIIGNRMANEYSEVGDGENVSANVVPGRRFFAKGRELTSDELPVQQAALNNTIVRDAEIDFILPSGERKVVIGSASPLYDSEGQVRGSIGAFIDITKRKEAEEALAKIEIAQKQEIHHRIKNNLQVISSLLDLQAEKFRGKKNIEDSQILEAFKESQDRVISMALIHEELHKGGEIDTLNFSHYIEELADNLLLTYRLCNDSISLDTDIEEDIFFDMDTSVPLGIIINELVSNSLKHAFTGMDKGKIQIKLCREGSNTSFILIVSDNGIGVPEDLDIKDLDSLGLQLVTTLVDQLDGELELKRNSGTEFTIKFTITEKNNLEFEKSII